MTSTAPFASPFTADPWEPFVFDPAAVIAPEQPIYDALLAKGDLAIWLGREKHRKSSVLMQFAICAALGRPFLHFPFRPSQGLKVVVLDYESKSQTIEKRYAALVESMGLSETEKQVLCASLKIVEMRKAFKTGLKFARFPVKPEKGLMDEFVLAEEEWRSFVRNMGADLYIIDPMRCMHAQAENDSALEALLSRVHQIFGDAAVVISHHLRKRDRRNQKLSLKDDMRVWADEARGSSAITAHADVIICQEREVVDAIEQLHLGAYLRMQPISSLWFCGNQVWRVFSGKLRRTFPLNLQCAWIYCDRQAGNFRTGRAAVDVLQRSVGAGRSTAYSRLKDLLNRGLLTGAKEH